MTFHTNPSLDRPRALVIGSGIGGLAAALRLVSDGMQVTVLERHATPGGKMRTLSSEVGPVDAGPTVLTLRDVFEDLFAHAGAKLEDHVRLHPQHLLARHFWPDGSKLDLTTSFEENKDAINKLSGPQNSDGFTRFCADTQALLAAFDAPMMRTAAPSRLAMTRTVASAPSLVPKMAPLSPMAARLRHYFTDERLCQLFGRYATYVGGSPHHSPALLSLIWQVESQGVWCVEGGMHRLAQAIANLAQARGAHMRYNSHVAKLTVERGCITGAQLNDGTHIPADLVVFNGDPRALATGTLGQDTAPVAAQTVRDARSLSARVWSFAARPDGPDLAHHNVFFTADAKAEFAALMRGDMPVDQTLYLCAQDRGEHLPRPQDAERFEIIANAAPLGLAPTPSEEMTRCRTQTFATLASFGLRFDPLPDLTTLTTPQGFETLFPQTQGSLYGQSPHGLMAAFRRPTARTRIKGLYLAGGGTHPGAGVPMAALSGKHAADMIKADLTSIWPSLQMAMPGGISME